MDLVLEKGICLLILDDPVMLPPCKPGMNLEILSENAQNIHRPFMNHLFQTLRACHSTLCLITCWTNFFFNCL